MARPTDDSTPWAELQVSPVQLGDRNAGAQLKRLRAAIERLRSARAGQGGPGDDDPDRCAAEADMLQALIDLEGRAAAEARRLLDQRGDD